MLLGLPMLLGFLCRCESVRILVQSIEIAVRFLLFVSLGTGYLEWGGGVRRALTMVFSVEYE